jgi:large exoprotein involved in heme utilization and adhesion
MNPAGVIFGPTATLNVGGMATFTTADYLRLADGARFNAMPHVRADALLSTAPVAAFGFLGSNPGAIAVQGSHLSVTEGMGISLIGGPINIQNGTLDNGTVQGTVQAANLTAPAGQINLASVASPGEVLFPNLESAQNINRQTFTALGHISLLQGTSLETSADTAGRIVIRGGQFIMDDASIKAISMNGPGGGIASPNSSPKISITAETAAFSNGALITADSYGTAAGGDIVLNVDVLTTQAGLNRLPLNPTNNFNFTGNFIASDSRSTDAGAGPAGAITIQGVGGPGTAATSVLLKDSTISSRVFGGTPQTTPSSITITADSLVLANEGLQAGGRAATIVANTLGSAPGGHVAFNVNTLRSNVTSDETPIAGAKTVFVISNNDPGITAGPTGTITISGIRPESTDAAQLVAVNNTFITTGVDGGNPRTAPGNITITTDTLSLDTGTQIFTASFGDGGAPAGNITLNVNTLRGNATHGALITGGSGALIGSVSLVSGQAGNVTISGVGPQTTDAAKLVALQNIELNMGVFSGTPQTAPAILTVTADTIHLTHSKIKTDTQGGAPAGNIFLTANTFLADDASGISSSGSAVGPGGNISITAGQSVTLNSGSSISASSTGSGNAGNISINSGNQFAMTNSSVTTQANQSSGGTIKITTSPSGTVELSNSKISASVLDGTGGGGSVNIDPQFVILQNSQILAQAVQGPGGNINITITNGGLFLPDASSVVSASSQFGQNGAVTIQAPIAPAGGKIQPLGKAPLQVTALLSQRCAAIARGEVSSFVMAGRDTLPTEPGGWLASPLAFGPPEAGAAVQAGEPSLSSESPSPLILSLRRLPSPSKVAQLLGDDWLTDCGS